MDLGLKDKVALVTGAGSQVGFGKAICLTLAQEGCDIVASDIDFEGAKKTAAEVEKLGRKAVAVTMPTPGCVRRRRAIFRCRRWAISHA